jgi:hypothetical protein
MLVQPLGVSAFAAVDAKALPKIIKAERDLISRYLNVFSKEKLFLNLSNNYLTMI